MGEREKVDWWGSWLEWLRGLEYDKVRVVRVPDPTVQQFGRGQVSERTGGVMVMSATVWVRLTVWVGEMQVGGRMGWGMVMNATVWVRSAVSVEEMQFYGRTGGGDGDELNSLGEVNSMGGGAELDSHTK